MAEQDLRSIFHILYFAAQAFCFQSRNFVGAAILQTRDTLCNCPLNIWPFPQFVTLCNLYFPFLCFVCSRVLVMICISHFHTVLVALWIPALGRDRCMTRPPTWPFPNLIFCRIRLLWPFQNIIFYTRSLGALQAPSSSLRPFGPPWLRALRPRDPEFNAHAQVCALDGVKNVTD